MSAAEQLRLGAVTVVLGERGGRYPQGNSLFIEGSRETAVIDPSLRLLALGDGLPRVQRVLSSHCHEDHIAGNHLFPEASWHAHEHDVEGLRSLDAMMEIYGYEGPTGDDFRRVLVEDFHYRARPDARSFTDGAVFDLGDVRVRVLHTPGHTRGHSCFLVEGRGCEDGLLYLGDIDLTSFGPYYGDAASDLEDFERSIELVRGVHVRWYATFHHIGVLEGREAFERRLERFAGRIEERERRLLEFLAEPRTLDEIARHRFVYRPQDEVPWAEAVERRSMEQHLERLERSGRVERLAGGRFRAR